MQLKVNNNNININITNNSKVLPNDNVSYSINEMELYNNLKLKFPNMSDETIQKIMNNNSNYKTITENKKLINKIVESVMNKIQKKSNQNNIIDISSNFDLGNMSPIE